MADCFIICVETAEMNGPLKTQCKQLPFQRWDCVDSWFPSHLSFKELTLPQHKPTLKHVSSAPTCLTYSVESFDGPSAMFESAGIRAYQGANCLSHSNAKVATSTFFATAFPVLKEPSASRTPLLSVYMTTESQTKSPQQKKEQIKAKKHIHK
jgi:hypothetical protein